VVLLYYFPNPTGAFERLEEVIVLLVLQLLPVKDSLREVRRPSDLGVDGIGNVAKEIIHLEHPMMLLFGG
jgi:hypothetical protein